MGKKRQYKDDYTGDVQSIQKRHQKFKVLMAALCVTGVVAAGSATYVLMNPAQTMTKEGIDEMDPNEDFVVTDEGAVFEDAIPAQDPAQNEENYDNVPLIEEWTDETKAPADAIPTEDPNAPEEAALPGAEPQAGAIVSDIEETETEPEIAEDTPALAGAAAAAVTETTAETIETDAPAAETDAPAAAEIVGVSETEAAETLETDAPAAETEAPAAVETEVPETEAVSTEAAQTEAAVTETEEAVAESEAAQTEIAETEEAEAETEAAETEISETEEAQSESATEPAESETQAAEIREKSKDEVYVETEGELLDEKWIDSVGLEIKTEDGWDKAETADSGAIEVDADQTLRFRVTYTVEPGTLSPEMRTLIYQIPKEVTKVDESYGEIVDAADHVLANYAIDEDGIIRVTFMEDVAQMNADGTKVTCKIEFKTKASNLAQ